MARASRDSMLPMLGKIVADLKKNGMPQDKVSEYVSAEIQSRMNLVMDCYLTGAAEMLKALHGDLEMEPWADQYDHEKRLTELLTQYGLLGERSTVQ